MDLKKNTYAWFVIGSKISGPINSRGEIPLGVYNVCTRTYTHTHVTFILDLLKRYLSFLRREKLYIIRAY